MRFFVILKNYFRAIFARNNDAWLSLVERCVRDAEVAGSNPVASIIRKSAANPLFMGISGSFCFWTKRTKPSKISVFAGVTQNVTQNFYILKSKMILAVTQTNLCKLLILPGLKQLALRKSS